MRERDLQEWVARYLDRLGFMWNHTANERRCSPRRGMELKRQGVKPGVADVQIYDTTQDGKKGLAIELKTTRGVVRKSQKSWLEGLRERGWEAMVCRSIDE